MRRLRLVAARVFRHLAGALTLVLVPALLPSGAAAAAEQKLVSLAFTDELLARVATDSQGEQTTEIINRVIGLSPSLLNVRLQRASGRVSFFVTTGADDAIPVEFQLTLDKMAYYRMRTARADAAGMTQALQEAKSFEPLLLEIAYRHDGRYAIVDCTVDLGPALAASRRVREQREAEARAVAEARAAEEARVAEESRATAALRAAATARAAAKTAGRDAARPAPAGAPAAEQPAASARPDPAQAVAAGGPSAPAPAQHPGHLSAKALGRETEPVVDGLFSDAAWLGAERYTFEVRGASGKIPVSAWALWSPERLWIMLRWPDRSKDDAHRPWTWSQEAKAYVAGSEVEDAVAVAFAREGRIGECMLSGREAASDLWTWRAARTDPSGFAEDATLTVRAQPFAGATSHPARGGGAVHIREDPDAGVGPYEAQPAGAFAGNRVPAFVARTPSGSAGDVMAKGSWKDGHWLVEFSRRLYSGDPADAILTPGKDAFLSVAIFSAREGADHSTSQEIVLRLE